MPRRRRVEAQGDAEVLVAGGVQVSQPGIIAGGEALGLGAGYVHPGIPAQQGAEPGTGGGIRDGVGRGEPGPQFAAPVPHGTVDQEGEEGVEQFAGRWRLTARCGAAERRHGRDQPRQAGAIARTVKHGEPACAQIAPGVTLQARLQLMLCQRLQRQQRGCVPEGDVIAEADVLRQRSRGKCDEEMQRSSGGERQHRHFPGRKRVGSSVEAPCVDQLG